MFSLDTSPNPSPIEVATGDSTSVMDWHPLPDSPYVPSPHNATSESHTVWADSSPPSPPKPGKMHAFVGLDPRAVGYVMGKGRKNLRKIGNDVFRSVGAKVYIQWNAPKKLWGRFVICSYNMDAVNMAKTRLKELEASFLLKVESGAIAYPLFRY
jgi:hypothetical protein